MSGTVRHNLPVSQPQVTSNINVSRPLPQQGTSATTSKNLFASVNVNNSNSETLNTCMSINFTYQDINLYILMLRCDIIFIVLLRCMLNDQVICI